MSRLDLEPGKLSEFLSMVIQSNVRREEVVLQLIKRYYSKYERVKFEGCIEGCFGWFGIVPELIIPVIAIDNCALCCGFSVYLPPFLAYYYNRGTRRILYIPNVKKVIEVDTDYACIEFEEEFGELEKIIKLGNIVDLSKYVGKRVKYF